MILQARRGASAARNLVALVILVVIVVAIVVVLNRPQPNAVILTKELATPLPGSALAEQYPLTSMLFQSEIRNDGATSDFDVEVEVHSANNNWTRSTQITIEKGQTETVILDFGTLDGARDELEFEISVSAR